MRPMLLAHDCRHGSPNRWDTCGCLGLPTSSRRLPARFSGTDIGIEKVAFSRAFPAISFPLMSTYPTGSRGPRPQSCSKRPLVYRQQDQPEFQAFCINMARFGFVVLNFDPFGQGETRGLLARP